MESLAEIRDRIAHLRAEREELVEIRNLLNAELDGASPIRRHKKGKVGRPKGSKNAPKVPTKAATGGFEFVPPLAGAAAVTALRSGVTKGRKGNKGRAVARPESALD
jgi:hypothetical protein